jgi:hypothetical protein
LLVFRVSDLHVNSSDWLTYVTSSKLPENVFFHCCILLSFNPFRSVLKWILNCDSSFVFHNELRKIVMLSWEDREDRFSEFLNLVFLDGLVLVSVKTNIQHWEMMIIMIYVRIMVSNGFFILELFSNKWLWYMCGDSD